jgi:RHS repeat-associated protein
MKHLHLLLTAVIIISFATVSSGQTQHKNQERGFSPNGVYASYDIDHINLFSGNLVVAVPIGQEYPVGGQLSYRLTLVYNSYLWSQREICASTIDFDTHYYSSYFYSNYTTGRAGGAEVPVAREGYDPYNPGPSRTKSDGCYTVQYPNPGANAGMGWQLTFGRLYYPNQDILSAKDLAVTTEKQDYVYQSPDGSEHTFYTTLHEGETKVANVSYTRDGSYLRMTKNSGGFFEIEFPNGVVYTFGNAQNGLTGGTELRVTKMRDQFNNWVTIDYTATEWNIMDSVGRHHVVKLSRLGTDFPNVVTSVSLDAFNNSSADYSFGYYTDNINRAYPHVPPGAIDGFTDTVNVSFLTSVTLPDGSKYRMPQADGYDYTGALTSTKSIGVLRKIVLPTGGSIEWQYKGESAEDDLIHHYGYPAASSARNYVRTSIGVRRRIVTEGERSYVWKYDPEPQASPVTGTNGEDCSSSGSYWWQPVCAPRLFINKVTTPKPDRIQSGKSEDGFATKYYFSFYPHPWDTRGRNVSDWHAAEYGLPMNKGVSVTDSKGQPLFLSTEVFADAAATSLKRSTYARYETDQWPAADGWGNLAETNARVVAERTVYNDDSSKYSETQYSDFDGLGHYRKVETAGNIGNDTTVTYTNYNPGLGTYAVSIQTNTLLASSTYSGFSTDRPWVLNTYDKVSVTEGTQTSTTYFNYDQQGRLYAKRIKKELKATNTCPGEQCSNDVLVQYSYDAFGNLTDEGYFGGDRPGHTSLDTSSRFPSLANSVSEYIINYQYQQCQLPDGSKGTLGVIKQKTYKDPKNNLPVSFKSVDNTIDCSTGLVSSSKDTAGVSTSYFYDTLARLSDVTPEQGSTQHIDYDVTNNKVTVQQQERPAPNPTPTPTYPTGGILGEKVYFYDQLGRVVIEKERLPGVKTPLTAVYIQRNTNYNGMNWVTDVSEFIPDAYSAEGRKTKYENFDPFGHAFKITTPDGHVVTMGYKGMREVTRTVRVGVQIDASGNVTEQEATTKEIYDGQGRLVTVEESAGANGQTVSWNYGYNVNDKLISATAKDPSTLVTQQRTFVYDNINNLLSEVLPERPTAQYAGYDTMGNVGNSSDGQHSLTYSYDNTERLKEVRELDGLTTQGRVLKSFVYDTATGSGKGKVASATRHNYILNPYPQNVASSAAGALASAPSVNTQYGDFNPKYAIDGRRTGAQWGVNGGWMDNNGDDWSNDWLKVQFNGNKTIDTVNVFSVQDNYTNPTEPTRSQTFTLYGLIDFQVQYLNGSSWVTLPGGNITNNNLVWRQIKFSPVTTSAIRIVVTRSGNALSRIAEVEALEVPSTNQPTVDVAVTEEYTYSGRDGRLSKKVTKMPYSPEVPNSGANVFEQTFAYDQLGNLMSQGYPRCLNSNCANPNLPGVSAQDRPWTENYEYKNGRIINIGGGPGINNTTMGNDASFGYQYSGMLGAVQHGNGVRDTLVDDPNSMQRAYRIYSKKADGTVIWDSGAGAPAGQENYRYDGAGNVVRIGRDWFLYDKVSRVVEGSALITGLKRQYSYDAFGNMTGDKTYSYVTTPANGSLTDNYTTSAVSSKNQFSLYYDAAGNALGLNPSITNPQPTILYTYDALNMIKSAPGVTYIYGPGDERVWMVNNQDRSNIVETITLRGLNNEVLREYQINGGDRAGHWAWLKDYFYGGSRLIASQAPSGGRHYHLDHLGTVRAISDTNGNLVNGTNYQYLPFGEEASAVPPAGERLRFTGHERDTDSYGISLDYMHARFYNSRGGKFMSVDPGRDWDMKQPQSWNLYSYVRNNPINARDPDGRFTGAVSQLFQAVNRAEQYLPANVLVNDCRVRAMLETLAYSEGTSSDSDGGYGRVVKGKVLKSPNDPSLVGKVDVTVTDLSKHPNVLVKVNRKTSSTAAGRYQFLYRTWVGLNLSDFGADNQDTGAVKLMKQRNMINPLLTGDVTQAMTNGNPEWASLPGSPYGQPTRSALSLQQVYTQALSECLGIP